MMNLRISRFCYGAKSRIRDSAEAESGKNKGLC